MPLHANAVKIIEEIMVKPAVWAIPWPCMHEFIAVVTNARIFKTPTPLSIAFDTIKSWHQGSNLTFLSESEGYLAVIESISRSAALSGAKIHDARIAALCLHHGIRELWTSDRDFSLFSNLNTVNPLV